MLMQFVTVMNELADIPLPWRLLDGNQVQLRSRKKTARRSCVL